MDARQGCWLWKMVVKCIFYFCSTDERWTVWIEGWSANGGCQCEPLTDLHWGILFQEPIRWPVIASWNEGYNFVSFVGNVGAEANVNDDRKWMWPGQSQADISSPHPTRQSISLRNKGSRKVWLRHLLLILLLLRGGGVDSVSSVSVAVRQFPADGRASPLDVRPSRMCELHGWRHKVRLWSRYSRGDLCILK